MYGCMYVFIFKAYYYFDDDGMYGMAWAILKQTKHQEEDEEKSDIRHWNYFAFFLSLS